MSLLPPPPFPSPQGPSRIGELLQPYRYTHLALHHAVPVCESSNPRGRIVGSELVFFQSDHPCPACLLALGYDPPGG